jgi:hypothetical protein
MGYPSPAHPALVVFKTSKHQNTLSLPLILRLCLFLGPIFVLLFGARSVLFLIRTLGLPACHVTFGLCSVPRGDDSVRS